MTNHIIDLISAGESEAPEFKKNFWKRGGYFSICHGEYHGWMGNARR